MNILKINKLTKNFFLHNANREIHSCRNISFTLEEGKFLGIVGRSGAGKSTILKCIHRTYIPTDGEIIYNSKAFGEINLTTATEREILYLRNHEIGYVSQFLNVMPRTTAKEHVMNALTETVTALMKQRKRLRKCLIISACPKTCGIFTPTHFPAENGSDLTLPIPW